jgi:hypothetical protein
MSDRVAPELAEPQPEPTWPLPAADLAPTPATSPTRRASRSATDPDGWPAPPWPRGWRRCQLCGHGVQLPATVCGLCLAERAGLRVHAAPLPAEVGQLRRALELPPIPPNRRASRYRDRESRLRPMLSR